MATETAKIHNLSGMTDWRSVTASVCLSGITLAREDTVPRSDDHDPKSDRSRRLFLEKAGRFAAVTPPTVALMLSATGSARAQASSSPTTTTFITTTTETTTTITLSTTGF